MKTTNASTGAPAGASSIVELRKEAWGDVRDSFEKFCLTCGIEVLQGMMQEDVAELAGERHERASDKSGYRWGSATSRLDFHGGKVPFDRPRVRDKITGKEIPPATWEHFSNGDLLREWAVNMMVMNVATRKFGRAMRLPETGIPVAPGDGLSRSVVSRRFKALTQARHDEWMSSDISRLDLVAIRIDGLHMRDDDGMLMLGAVGVELDGTKHALGVVEGATENAAAVQALLDNLIERGLDPEGCHLFIVDGSKASSKAIRRALGADIPGRRCQVHKSRNILDRLPKGHRVSARRAPRQAWNMSDAGKAETMIRNLARRLEREAPGVSRSILEGLDEILTVTRPGLPPELRKSPGSTNIIESMNSVVRQVSRNVKRWRDASMALRWTSSGMFEAQKGFRRINACRQLPLLEQALARHRDRPQVDVMEDAAQGSSRIPRSGEFQYRSGHSLERRS